MFDTNEDRQTAYQQLVQALLHCPEHSEDRVLAANPHLVDEGLVRALLDTAETMKSHRDPAEISTIDWLVNFASQLVVGQEQKQERDRSAYRQHAYQQLVQALLHCPQNSEDRVLAANPDLVDEGLIKALLDTAETMKNRHDPTEASTIDWLVNFAAELVVGKDDRKEYDRLSVDLLQVVIDGEAGTQDVHKFFDAHLAQIDEKLLAVFPDRIKDLLEREDDGESRFSIASAVGHLGNELQQFPRGNRSINLELAIVCYECALLVMTQADFPLEWATTENNRASAYNDRIEGDRSANLESAIIGYDRALLVMTQADFPLEWATTENNRASAYNDRIEGDRVDNLDKAIAGYDLALLVLTEADFPKEWATISSNRANAYSDRIQCNRWLKKPEKIAESLETLENSPVDSIPERIEIPPVEIEIPNPNEDRQIAYLEIIRLLLECPHGDEYRILAEQPELIDEGLVMALIDTAEKKVELNEPELVGTIQWLVNFAEKLAGKLGFEVSDVAGMDRSEEEYIEFSIDLLQSVANSEGDAQPVHQFLDEHLTYLTPTLLATFPKLIETLLDREEDPDRRSYIISTLYNLSIDLSEFPRGDRSITLQLSIVCQERYLSIITEAAQLSKQQEAQTVNPVEAARITALNLSENDYGVFFSQLFQTVASSDGNGKIVHHFLDEHVDYLNPTFLELLPQFIEQLFAQSNNPDVIAQTAAWCDSLAVDLDEYTKGNRSTNLGMAIVCHEQALTARINLESPIETVACDLAPTDQIQTEKQVEPTETPIFTAKEHRQIPHIEIEDGDNWGFFIELFKTVLASQGNTQIVHQFLDTYLTYLTPAFLALFPEFLNKLFATFDDAQVKSTLAGQFNHLAGDFHGFSSGSRSINLQLAIACYDRILLESPLFGGTSPLENRSTIEHNRANAERELLEVNSAEQLYQLSVNLEPLDLQPQTLIVFTNTAARIDKLQADRDLGDSYFAQGEWQRAMDSYEMAIETVETSTNWVVDKSMRKELLEDAPAIYENALQCAINLHNYPRAIEYTERSRSRQLVELIAPKDFCRNAKISVEIDRYLREYQALDRQIQKLCELENYDNTAINTLEQQKRIKYLAIRNLDPAIAGQIAVAPIDFKNIQKLITSPHTAILTCYSTADDTHIFIIKQSGAPTIHTCKTQGSQKFQQWLQTNWLNPYHNHLATWKQKVPRLLHNISDKLQLDTLIEEHLTDITELIIVPHLNLHQIPFAALPVIGADYLLSEKFTIRTIPSCQILQYCQERTPITTADIGTIEDAEDRSLGARYEGEQIAALYHIPPSNRLIGSTQATATNYRALLARVNRLHSSHHTISKPHQPLESALILAKGARITLHDLLVGERYPHLDEVFLSGCDTSVGITSSTQDIATLTTGFLSIGARSVQSTLWKVDDLVIAIFNLFYHQERQKGINPTISLQTAQQQLRNLTQAEFIDVYYPQAIEYVTQHNPALLPNLTAHLKAYCTTEHPFEHPYYWGAFITQGMA